MLRLQGDPEPDIFLLRDGWLACSLVHDSGKRQITKIHLPGDLVGVPSFASDVAAETIHALSPAAVGVIDPPAIGDVFRNHPRMAAFLFLSAQEERVLLMERLAAIGQTSALVRIAGLILNLHDRMRLIEPNSVDTFLAPLSQEEVGDATGLTSVSVNVALKTLRNDAIASWSKGTLHILNRTELERMTGYVPRPPRNLRWLDRTQS